MKYSYWKSWISLTEYNLMSGSEVHLSISNSECIACAYLLGWKVKPFVDGLIWSDLFQIEYFNAFSIVWFDSHRISNITNAFVKEFACGKQKPVLLEVAQWQWITSQQRYRKPILTLLIWDLAGASGTSDLILLQFYKQWKLHFLPEDP